MQVKQYPFTEEDFERFRQLISRESGIFFDRGKWDILRLGLTDRATITGMESLQDYYELLTSEEEHDRELRRLLDHLSVQETQFFRNLPQFDALRKYIIPEIAKRKSGSHRNIRMWSAGCSTGQEPYSLAMSVMDVIPDIEGWNIKITGTDLNEKALDVARQGWYPEKKLNGLDRHHIERYMREESGGYVVNETVRNLVDFKRLNLVTDPLPIEEVGTCDVIFCRNVIIYFTHETAKYVIEHFFDILNPGGYLFLGHSETLWKMSNKYSLVEIGDAFIYKKSLPRGINGRRFIPDRRMRKGPLPAGVGEDRRKGQGRRSGTGEAAMIASEPAEAGAGTAEKQLPEPLQQAKSQLELGEYRQAIHTLNTKLEQDATSAHANFLLGLAHEKEDELEQAAEYFRKTIYCDDRFSIAYFHLASILERSGMLKDAVREYRNAAKYLRKDAPDRWEKELGDYGVESLVDLCEWKMENLGGIS